MSSGEYAKNTQVSVEQSRIEIERTLARYGAERFMYGYTEKSATVVFEVHDRRVRFTLPLLEMSAFSHDARNRKRTREHQTNAHKAEQRRRWRALALVIKAKLEAVDSGIVSFDEEFLAHLVMSDGDTVGEYLTPQLQHVLTTGNLPPMLGDGR